jgi:hypothetical protein
MDEDLQGPVTRVDAESFRNVSIRQRRSIEKVYMPVNSLSYIYHIYVV